MNIRHQLICLLTITLLSFIGGASAYANNLEKLEDGQNAFNLGYYLKAFKIWHSQALTGDSDAQMFVGLAFRNGWGIPKDQEEAIKWYKLAAEQGNTAAQFLLGLSLMGSDNNNEVETGIQWLHKAAANGDSEALQFLDKAKRKQWFVVSDDVKAPAADANAVEPTQKQELPKPVSVSLSDPKLLTLPSRKAKK